MDKAIYVFVAIAVVAGIARFFIPSNQDIAPTIPGEINCPEVEKICSDGSYAERQGTSCEYTCPPEVPDDVRAMIEAKADLITFWSPVPHEEIESPLHIAGKARGNWFFEASFPVILTNWDGLIIAQGIATAEDDWMTTEFVPFSATLEFTSPYPEGGQDFMKRGSLILQKDNPSGLPELNDALEIPVRFAP